MLELKGVGGFERATNWFCDLTMNGPLRVISHALTLIFPDFCSRLSQSKDSNKDSRGKDKKVKKKPAQMDIVIMRLVDHATGDLNLRYVFPTLYVKRSTAKKLRQFLVTKLNNAFDEADDGIERRPKFIVNWTDIQECWNDNDWESAWDPKSYDGQ